MSFSLLGGPHNSRAGRKSGEARERESGAIG